MRGNPEPPLRFGVLCLTSSGSIVNERQAWSRLKNAIHQFTIIKLKYSLTPRCHTNKWISGAPFEDGSQDFSVLSLKSAPRSSGG